MPRPGRMVAVTGPSGAGKTTLLWALAGLWSGPRRARSTVDGAVPQDRDETSAAGVVLIPQDNALASVLTASENVARAVAGRRGAAGRARPNGPTEALEAVGLGDRRRPARSRSCPAASSSAWRWPAASPSGAASVLADEPTSELDAVNRARVVLLLRAEADRGAAVVLATHDPEAAAECDAELHLDAGEATWVRPLT